MTLAVRRKASPQPRAALKPAPPPETRHRLGGNSGAVVELHALASHSFVRKTAADRAANDRLLRQATKQRELARLGMSFARVMADGTDEAGLAFFDMEYVPGRTVADAVINAASFDAGAVFEAVDRMLRLFKTCAGAEIPAARFHDKIAEVEAASAVRPACAALRPEIRKCALALHARDWTGIPQSMSHGDLTLENILIARGQGVRFIDCDEAWVSSYWLDIGKLFQDLEGHWCIRALYRADVRPVRRTNAIQKLESLARGFRALAAANDPALPARLPQLAALGLFRALPYARDEVVPGFICARIESLLGAVP